MGVDSTMLGLTDEPWGDINQVQVVPIDLVNVSPSVLRHNATHEVAVNFGGRSKVGNFLRQATLLFQEISWEGCGAEVRGRSLSLGCQVVLEVGETAIGILRGNMRAVSIGVVRVFQSVLQSTHFRVQLALQLTLPRVLRVSTLERIAKIREKVKICIKIAII